MATTSQYRAHLKRYGLARSNRFEVEFTLPDKLTANFAESQADKVGFLADLQKVGDYVRKAKDILGIGGPNFKRGLSMMCETAEMPGLNLATTENKINGIQHRQVYGKIYNEAQFVFTLSQDMYEKDLIDAWMAMIVNDNDYNVEYYNNYASTVVIHQLDNAGRRVHSVVLEGAYPMSSTPLTLNTTDSGNINKLSTNFVYRRWYKLDSGYTGGHTNVATTLLGPAFQQITNSPGGRIALNVLNKAGLDLTGEALNVYNQLDNILRSAVDMDTNSTARLLNAIKADVDGNSLLTVDDRSALSSVIDNIKGNL